MNSQERPILFSAPMVRAILAGVKTQTRRIVKGTPGRVAWHPVVVAGHGGWVDEHGRPVRCRYGQPRDLLWVRETWGYFDPTGTGEDYDYEHESAGPGPAAYCDELLQEGHPLREFWRRRVAYKASLAEPKYGMGPAGPRKWRPSIHMPRWASRITLEVTGVRVERLQDISEADALAEGVESAGAIGHLTWWRNYLLTDAEAECSPALSSTRDSYRTLWESINGPGSWDANPWVWVIEFSREGSECEASRREAA